MKSLKNTLTLALICLATATPLHSANLLKKALPAIGLGLGAGLELAILYELEKDLYDSRCKEIRDNKLKQMIHEAKSSIHEKKCAQQKPLYEQFQKVSTIIRKSTKDIERFWGINTPLPLDIKDDKYDLSELQTLSSLLSLTKFLQISYSLWYPSMSFKPQSGEFAGKSLHFIRVRHRATEIDPGHDEFNEHIKRVIETEKPDLIIIEGILTHLGLLTNPSPQQNPFFQKMETLKTLSIASQHNIPCIGGEPSELVTTQPVLEHKFGRYIAFSTQGLANNYYDYRNWLSKHTTNLNTYEKKNFEYLWMKQYQKYATEHEKNKHASINIVYYNYTLYNDLKVYARDRHTLNLIFHALKQYNKVLIVYGASHFYTQEDVLEKHLGKPENLSNTYYDKKEIEQPAID